MIINTRMDPELANEIGSLAKLSHRRIFHVLEGDSPRRYDLTKALVNVLYNLCVIQSIETDQKKVFEKHQSVIKTLLSSKTTLAAKKKLLQANLDLVLALAETCLQNA